MPKNMIQIGKGGGGGGGGGRRLKNMAFKGGEQMGHEIKSR